MGALAMDTNISNNNNSPWLPQDDLLLKNSIEGGASLEALAKGAVEFSRKFSIAELRERWLALLYDPVISEQACARMAEYEQSMVQSKSKKADDTKELQLGCGKRKTESVRNCYYAMKKRLCNDQLFQGDLSFLMDNCFSITGSMNVAEDPMATQFAVVDANFDGLPDNVPSQVMEAGNNVVMAGNYDTFGGETFPSDQPYVCNTSEPTGMEFISTNPDCGNSFSDLPYTTAPGADCMQSEGGNHMSFDLKDTTGSPGIGELFAALEDPFFGFTSEDEFLFGVNDGKGVVGDAFIDQVSAVLMSSPEKGFDGEMCNVPDMQEAAVGVNYSSMGSEVFSNGGDIHMKESSHDVSLANPSFTTFGTFDACPEYRNGAICCVLNTEDPEIPCNDDIVFPSKRPASIHKKNNNKSSSNGKDNRGSQVIRKGPSVMETVPAQTTKQLGLNQSGVVKHETHDTYQSHAAVMKEFSDVVGCVKAEKLVHIAESTPEYNQATQNQCPSKFVDPVAAEPDCEILPSETEEQFYESETDLPDFSDIESMILDMDLGPADPETVGLANVSKYQDENAKRAIIRLEQVAHSYMQRDIASHGAFAILYSRLSKHYIKKPEVSLGRATNDCKVDIDLATEGLAFKISRRQAVIKMKSDGTFSIINRGRCSIYVNGNEVAPGQYHALYSNCLIEIKDMTFIFEVSQSRVKQYLDNAVQ